MFHLLLAEAKKDTLTFFMGNTFALAVWWVIAGVVSGVFLALFGGTAVFLLTGQRQQQQQIERRIGILGGALVGMSGGATVGNISDFSGLIGLVYLWAFVGIMYSTLMGTSASRAPRGGFDEDWDPRNRRLDPSDRTISFLDEWSTTFSRLKSEERRPEEMMGAFGGIVIGVFYGTITGLIIPLSVTEGIEADPARTIVGAAIIWAILGGFGGWAGSRRLGAHAGMVALVTGIMGGSALGGVLALVGQILGDVVCGAINGVIGGAFFGAVAASELINQRFLD